MWPDLDGRPDRCALLSVAQVFGAGAVLQHDQAFAQAVHVSVVMAGGCLCVQ